jgi:hypothetical protein
MGVKFAHFSIFNSNLEEAIGLLNLLPKPPNKLDIMKKAFPKEYADLINKKDNPMIKPILDYMSSGEIWYMVTLLPIFSIFNLSHSLSINL